MEVMEGATIEQQLPQPGGNGSFHRTAVEYSMKLLLWELP